MNKLLISSLRAGVIVGVLDGTAACVNAYLRNGVPPSGVFRYVASGYFGSSAFTGNGSIVLFGLGFHFFIAIAWTSLFFILSTKFDMLGKYKISAGIGYGIFIWLAMNGVVLPLSNVAPPVYKVVPTLAMIGIHIFVIGLVISTLASRSLKK